MSLPKKRQRIDLRVTRNDVILWRRIADAEKVTLSDWIRHACNDRADAFKQRSR